MLIKWLCVFAMGAFLYFQLNGEKVSETGFAQMSSAVTASADLTKMQKIGRASCRERVYVLV